MTGCVAVLRRRAAKLLPLLPTHHSDFDTRCSAVPLALCLASAAAGLSTEGTVCSPTGKQSRRRPAYAPMLQALLNGRGHSPEAAGKKGQRPISATGCAGMPITPCSLRCPAWGSTSTKSCFQGGAVPSISDLVAPACRLTVASLSCSISAQADKLTPSSIPGACHAIHHRRNPCPT